MRTNWRPACESGGASMAWAVDENPAHDFGGCGGPQPPTSKVLSFEVDFALMRGQMNAKLQAQAMVLGSPVTYLDDEEARKAEANKPATIGRAWDLWKQKAMGK